MKINRKSHFQAEVSTSSLNDIMFFLLLFFLIISTVTNPNVIKVMIPQSKAAKSLNKQSIILTITENKQFYINKKPIPQKDLEQELIKASAGLSEPTVVIHIYKNLTVQDLTEILALGTRNKIKMVLATKNN